jgi:hypothetical protein
MKNNKGLTELIESKATLGNYISEIEARKVLKRSTTWFWELRKKGFPFTKLGGETFYRIQDFVALLEQGFKNKF